MQVLITGAAGHVGTIVTRGLEDRHTIRGFDVKPMPDLEDTVVGNLTDYPLVLEAVRGVDAVIHLGGLASGRWPWEDILQSNFIGNGLEG